MADHMHIQIHIHIDGPCLVCLAPVADGERIKLVEERGHYAAFTPEGRLVWADACFGWVHLGHTN